MKGKTNPDLFLLLLHDSVRDLLEEGIEVPITLKVKGIHEVRIDFYTGSTGNIDLKTVVIYGVDDFENPQKSTIIFYIKKDGSYTNNHLSVEQLEFILSLPENIRYEDSDKFYDFYAIPETMEFINDEEEEDEVSLDDKLKEAIDNEDYELAAKIQSEINALNV